MLYETEIKIKLGSDERLSAVVSLCTNLYGKGESLLQVDEYFDTPDQILKKEDFTLRLRTINGVVRVAMKNERERLTETMHKRIELEFTAADEREIREQIQNQGLTATAIYEKHRWRYKTPDSKIVIDKLPFIGTFVEVEAASIRRIKNILNRTNH